MVSGHMGSTDEGKGTAVKYRVLVPIELATGELHYEVEAESEQEAIDAVRKGEARCIHQEISIDKTSDEEDWDIEIS